MTRLNRASRRARKSNKISRIAYRITEWSDMTSTSRVTTWRAIKNRTLQVIDYNGIKLIPASEAVRLRFLDAAE